MPNDEERASTPMPRSTSTRLPGLWQAAVIAALSAVTFGYWARPSAGTGNAPTALNVSDLTEVRPDEMTNALTTLNATQDQLRQLQERRSCGDRLAWVTIMRSPGQPAGQIRLQSGRYVSPAFELTDTPVRVALPYPAPYPVGRGTVAVLGTTVDAVVALTPPWPVSAKAGWHAREVTWTPSDDCPRAGK